MYRLTAAFAAIGVCAGFVVAVRATHASRVWPDRRPIGAIFLASYSAASPANPRGWFTSQTLDVVGSGGPERFRRAMLDYADRSIPVLKNTHAQGMIVWDIEGEEFPQKTSYIGDPRLLPRLAPEADAVADEFFGRFRRAGLAVGLTIRPQQLFFDAAGNAAQREAPDYERLLIEKIDYARARWGATLFYIDSNAGPRWPSEAFRLRKVAGLRPQVLLIPEHSDVLYYGFSAPYERMQTGAAATSWAVHLLYPKAFKILVIGSTGDRETVLKEALRAGDVPLFPAWGENGKASMLARLIASPGPNPQ